MAQEKKIEITISPTGEVSFTMKGVKGKACLEETQFLENALGGEVTVREDTTEMYEQAEVDTEVQYTK